MPVLRACSVLLCRYSVDAGLRASGKKARHASLARGQSVAAALQCCWTGVWVQSLQKRRFALRRRGDLELLGIAARKPSRYPDAAVSSLSRNAGYTLPSAI